MPSLRPPGMDSAPPRKVRVVINRGGGSFADGKAEKLEKLFADRGIEAEILAV